MNELRERHLSRWPWCTLAVLIGTLIAAASPGLSAWLTFERDAVAAGEVWRILTGHLAHWSWQHLFWDGLALAVLGTVAERQSRSRMIGCVVGSAVVICAGVWALQPELQSYRGMSGVDSALFVLAAVVLLRGALREGARGQVLFAGGCLLAFMGRTGLEWCLGEPLFVDSGASGFAPVPMAHVLGGLVGAVIGFVPQVRRVDGGWVRSARRTVEFACKRLHRRITWMPAKVPSGTSTATDARRTLSS